jgi:hypothetical protein
MLLTKNAKDSDRSESKWYMHRNQRCLWVTYFKSLASVAINVMNPFCCGTTQGTMAERAIVAVTEILTEK